MANNGSTDQVKKNWKWILLGAVVLFVLINFTWPDIYKFGCCTYNGERKCNVTGGGGAPASGWNGTCTEEIEDECCMPVDLCDGQVVDNPYECYHYYCTAADECCYAEYQEGQVQGGMYKCTCKNTEDMWVR